MSHTGIKFTSSNAETDMNLKVLDGALQEQDRFGLRKCKMKCKETVKNPFFHALEGPVANMMKPSSA